MVRTLVKVFLRAVAVTRRCGVSLSISTLRKGRTWFIIHGEMNFGALVVNEIKEKVGILLRVKKAECAIHITTVNNTSVSLYLLMVSREKIGKNRG